MRQKLRETVIAGDSIPNQHIHYADLKSLKTKP